MSLEDIRSATATGVGVSRTGSWVVVTQERIDEFARATDDFQFIHVDPLRARAQSPWGETIAHGFLTLSLLPMLMSSIGKTPGLPSQRAGINYGFDRVRFVSPVLVNSSLRGLRTLNSVVVRDSRTLQLTYDVTIEIRGKDQPACVAKWLVLALY